MTFRPPPRLVIHYDTTCTVVQRSTKVEIECRASWENTALCLISYVDVVQTYVLSPGKTPVISDQSHSQQSGGLARYVIQTVVRDVKECSLPCLLYFCLHNSIIILFVRYFHLM